MADLSDINSAQSIKIIGANISGIETTPVNSTTDGRLLVHNAITEISHVNRVDVVSAARTISGDSGILDSNGFGTLVFSANITAVSGTNPTLQLVLEMSEDGLNWTTVAKTARFTTTMVYREQKISLAAKYYRYGWLISGDAAPSFTFNITTTLKPYLSERSVSISNYSDVSMTVLGNTSTVFTAWECDNITLVTFRADDGGSNGQFKIQGSTNGQTWIDITGNITQGRNTTLLNTFTGQAFRYYRLIITQATNAGSRVLDIHWGAN